MKKGREDPWGNGAWFGIKEIKIIGRQENAQTKRDLLKTFFNEKTTDTINSPMQKAISEYLDEKFFSK